MTQQDVRLDDTPPAGVVTATYPTGPVPAHPPEHLSGLVDPVDGGRGPLTWQLRTDLVTGLSPEEARRAVDRFTEWRNAFARSVRVASTELVGDLSRWAAGVLPGPAALSLDLCSPTILDPSECHSLAEGMRALQLVLPSYSSDAWEVVSVDGVVRHQRAPAPQQGREQLAHHAGLTLYLDPADGLVLHRRGSHERYVLHWSAAPLGSVSATTEADDDLEDADVVVHGKVAAALLRLCGHTSRAELRPVPARDVLSALALTLETVARDAAQAGAPLVLHLRTPTPRRTATRAAV